MAELKVYVVADEIENLLRESRTMPLSGGMVLVNRQAMENLINDLKNAFPENVERAERLLERERELLNKIETQRREVESKAQEDARKTMDEANRYAQKTVKEAKETAETTVANAHAAAEEEKRVASEQANQMMMGARDYAQRLLNKAQADANRMVAEDSITKAAQKYADDIRRTAELENERLNRETLSALHQMMEHVDNSLSGQLSTLRALRQEMGAQVAEEAPQTFEESIYPDVSYNE